MGSPLRINHLDIKQHIKGMLFLFIPQISVSLYTVLSKVVLGAMGYIEGASFFDSADKIIRLIFTILSSLSTVLLPLISSELSNKNFDNVKRIIKLSLEFSLFVAIGMFFGLFSISKTFVPLFLGQGFEPVTTMLQWQSLILIPMAVANVIGNQYFIPKRKEKLLTLSIISGSLFSVIASIPAINSFGPLGASITIIISECLVTTLQVILSRRELELFGIIREIVKYMISGLIMAFSLFYLDVYIDGWLFVVLAIIIGSTVYIGICILLKITLIEQIKLIMSKKVIFGK